MIQNLDTMNDLRKAVESEDLALARLILQGMSSLNIKRYHELVVIATKKKNFKLVEVLLDSGRSCVEYNDKKSYSHQEDPAAIAILNDDEKLANLIIWNCQPKNVDVKFKKESLLELAVAKEMHSTVELIIQRTKNRENAIRSLKKCVMKDDIISTETIIAYFGRQIIFHELDGSSAFLLSRGDIRKLFSQVIRGEIPYLITEADRWTCAKCERELSNCETVHRAIDGYIIDRKYHCLYCSLRKSDKEEIERNKLYDFTEFENQRLARIDKMSLSSDKSSLRVRPYKPQTCRCVIS